MKNSMNKKLIFAKFNNNAVKTAMHNKNEKTIKIFNEMLNEEVTRLSQEEQDAIIYAKELLEKVNTRI